MLCGKPIKNITPLILIHARIIYIFDIDRKLSSSIASVTLRFYAHYNTVDENVNVI